MQAIFVCSRVRSFCYEHVEAAGEILAQLRDAAWRDKCVKVVPKMGWELLSEGLLWLQVRQERQWSNELPYVFLRLAESASDDHGKARLFVSGLVMSSIAGGTTSALKAVADSPKRNALRPVLEEVRRTIGVMSTICEASVALRLRSVRCVLDQLLG